MYLADTMETTEKIKLLRELNQLSQEQMAEKLHLTREGYAKIERGERGLDIVKLERIAAVFGMNAAELLAIGEKSTVYLIHENSHYHYNHHSNNIYSDTELSAKIEKLELQLAHKDELLQQKQREIELMQKLLDKNQAAWKRFFRFRQPCFKNLLLFRQYGH